MTTTLSRNLTALARVNHDLANRIAGAEAVHPGMGDWPDVGAEFHARDAGIVVVVGFGFGDIPGRIMKAMGAHGVVIVYEPDIGRLRGAMDRADIPWLGYASLRICTDKADAAKTLAGLEQLLACGVKVLDHPPSTARLDDGFMESFVNALKAMRTNVVTSCILTETITENAIRNAAKFVQSPGVLPLMGVHKGRPAVVVSAGPSLSRNLSRLLVNGYEDRFVVIATQTVLKLMLAIGLRPHYVCAIDWSDLSGRFYEGLTAADVRGIELVCQPSVHPIVPDRWPGVVRFCYDETLSDLLGEDTRATYGVLPPGATVANTCYYLARYMGCEPVILIGQDLGYTDGLYYGAGAAIHNTWQSELNEFRTLEMMEHERVQRGREGGKYVVDCDGRPMRTDVAMITYLEGFNAMFRADAARGLTVIDATEGGAAKAATVRMTFADALEKYDPGTDHRIGRLAGLRRVSLEAELRRAEAGSLHEAAGKAIAT
jgi:hypothetical protein